MLAFARLGTLLWILTAAGWLLAISTSRAAERQFANVPPGDEIEVLDPNADAQGGPAVELRHDKDGQLEVVVPPAVLVHKYYYTGDRSFQAQMLPGGPTIIVANHPKTGERCYIETSMMPGAPRVTYTGKSITYDFGEHGMTLQFPILGQPKIQYRSGKTFAQKIKRLVHTDQLKEHANRSRQRSRMAVASSRASLKEFAIDTGDMLQGVLLPVKQMVRLLPLGTAGFDPDRRQIQAEKIAEHQRQKEAELFRKQQLLDQVSLPTNR